MGTRRQSNAERRLCRVSALRKNVAGQVLTFCLVNATTGAALTGATVTTKAALDGTQSAGAGTVTELGTGQYKYVPTQGETNGTTAGFLFTATNAVPVNLHCFITTADPTDAVRMGLTALPNAAAEAAGGLYTRGTGAGQIAQDANGNVRANLDTIKTQAVTCAAGVTVLASVGTAATSTAQTADNNTKLADIQTRLPAALTANGNMKSSLMEILTTALTETAGLLAGGFKKFFNIATPQATMDHGILVDTATNLTTIPTGIIDANVVRVRGVSIDSGIVDYL